MTKPPTVPQMLARSTDGHRTALERVGDGRPLARVGATIGEVRGLRTILATLYRWVVASADKPKVGAGGSTTFPLVLTDRGRELLDALNARKAKARP